MENYEKGFKKWAPLFVFAVLIVLLLQLFNYLPQIQLWFQTLFRVLSPFILGVGIAYILNIPCSKINSMLSKSKVKFIAKHHKGLSVSATYLLAILALSLLLSAIIPLMIAGLMDLARVLPGHFERLMASPLVASYMSHIDTSLLDNLNVRSAFSIANIFQSIAANVLATTRNIISLSSSLVTLFLGVVSSIYFLLYSESITKFFIRLLYAILPKKQLDITLKYARNLHLYFHKSLFFQVIDCVILGTIATIGLLIIGVDYAVLFGLLLGVLNIIPYFGAIFGSISVIIFTLFAHGFTTGLICAAFLLTTQQIDGNIIQPKLMGTSLKLNPLFIIIAISIGGFYFGVLGMIAAIPIATLVRDIVTDFMTYLESKKSES